jgi:hypothetical protein
MKVDLVKYQIPQVLPEFFSPGGVGQTPWQIPTNRIELYRWSRYLIENNAYAHQMIDTLSETAIYGFHLQGYNAEWFTRELNGLQIENKMVDILKEYFGVGDCFTLLNIDCPLCYSDSNECSHQGAHFSAINILAPQNIEVVCPDTTHQMIFMRTTNELRKMLMTEPKETYEQMPEEIRNCVRQNKPFQLNPRYVHHFKYGVSEFQSYGQSILRPYIEDLIYHKSKNIVINLEKEIQQIRMEWARVKLTTWLVKIIDSLAVFNNISETPNIWWGDLRKND